MRHVFPNVLLLLAGFPGSAFAAGGAGEGGALVTVFFAFLAVIVVFQLIPAMVLFGGMVKGLFTRPPQEGALLRKDGKPLAKG